MSKKIKDFIDKGFQALILLPEIALTNQFSRRFEKFFGAQQAIWFSLAALLSICVSAVSGAFVTGFHSSKLNNEGYGLAMLSYSSYITTLNRSVKFVWKNCKTNFQA